MLAGVNGNIFWPEKSHLLTKSIEKLTQYYMKTRHGSNTHYKPSKMCTRIQNRYTLTLYSNWEILGFLSKNRVVEKSEVLPEAVLSASPWNYITWLDWVGFVPLWMPLWPSLHHSGLGWFSEITPAWRTKKKNVGLNYLWASTHDKVHLRCSW